MKQHLIGMAVTAVLAACASETAPVAEDQSAELVGGTAEARWQGVGYLVDTAGANTALCGATLIAPNVVVTAGHCAWRNRTKKLAFGTGELQAKKRTAVVEIAYDPGAHLEAQGSIDLVHTLLLNDLAYLVLATAVPGVEPIALQATKPVMACNAHLVGYGQNNSNQLVRKGVDGCVLFNAKLGSDAIVEVRPTKGGAVCHRDGDEGHPALLVGSDGKPQLLGVYVGSVTQGLTDCKKFLQLLNGYEASFGHAAFYNQGIARGKQVLGQ